MNAETTIIQRSPQQVAKQARELLAKQIQDCASGEKRLSGFESNDIVINPTSPLAEGIVRLIHERTVTRNEVVAAIGEPSAQKLFEVTEPRILGATLAEIARFSDEELGMMTRNIEVLQVNLAEKEVRIRGRSEEEFYLGWLLETERGY